MTAYIKTFLVFTLVMMLTASCEKKDPPSSNTNDPVYLGTITGKINLMKTPYV